MGSRRQSAAARQAVPPPEGKRTDTRLGRHERCGGRAVGACDCVEGLASRLGRNDSESTTRPTHARRHRARRSAERGLLVARRGDELQIQAQATASGTDVTVNLRDSDHAEVALPQLLVRYVMRTRDLVILEDASSQNLFSADPYLVQHRAR